MRGFASPGSDLDPRLEGRGLCLWGRTGGGLGGVSYAARDGCGGGGAGAGLCVVSHRLDPIWIPAWKAAVYAFGAGLVVALAVFHMPPVMVAGAVAQGLVYAWFRIAWIRSGSPPGRPRFMPLGPDWWWPWRCFICRP